MADAGTNGPPHFGLPDKVRGQWPSEPIHISPCSPLGEHRRPIGSVPAEEIGKVRRSGPPPARAVFVGTVSEVRGQNRTPRLVHRLVDDRQDRPQHSPAGPWLVGRVQVLHCRQRASDEHRGRRKVDVGGNAVRTRRARSLGPERHRQCLSQPAFDAASRYRDHLGGERVRQRRCQHLGQRRCQRARTCSAMNPQNQLCSPNARTEVRSPDPTRADRHLSPSNSPIANEVHAKSSSPRRHLG